MKVPFLLFLFLATPVLAQEKTLTDVDRQLLLERLKEIRNSSDSTVKGRVQVALSAFRKGRASDSAAHELYLKCVEKVRFEDQLRKSSEFRDWRNRHKVRTDSPSFRLALRHQLNYLTLVLEAASAPEGKDFSSKAIAVVDSILQDAEELAGQERLLRDNVLGTVFADAYSVKSIKVDNWPANPLDIDGIYDNLVLPPLQNGDSLPALKRAWLKRIEQEGSLLEKWARAGTSDKDRKPAFEKWLEEGRKSLIWKMEIDLFNAGDEKGASIRMLKHLKENLTHKSAPQWIRQFTTLVQPPPVTVEIPETPETPPTKENP